MRSFTNHRHLSLVLLEMHRPYRVVVNLCLTTMCIAVLRDVARTLSKDAAPCIPWRVSATPSVALRNVYLHTYRLRCNLKEYMADTSEVFA